MLNSRPLFPMSNDPNDFSPLTPGHFLIGDSMISLPQEDIFINSNQRFKLLQKVYQDFWKSWKRDYLTELQVRKKWFINGPQLAIGDLVLIAENNEPPLMWKTGQVVKLFEGNDGISRVSELQTITGNCVRPVAKLRKLPLDPVINGYDTTTSSNL